MRIIRASAWITLVALALALPASASDVASILGQVQAKKLARWSGVNNYTVEQSTAGLRALLYYERVDVPTPDGGSAPYFRLVQMDEISDRHAAADGVPIMTPEELNQAARVYRAAGTGMSTAMEEELAKAGLPRGLLKASGSPDQPWLSMDPEIMLGGMADMLDFTAQARREMEARDPKAEGRQEAADMASFASKARFAGEEPVDGRRAFLLRADEVNQRELIDGQEFTIQTVSLWIDSAEYVPLRMKVEGTMTSGRDTQPMTIERLDQDYRQVGSLYESHRQVMRIGGMMSASDQAELRKAQQQLAEFEAQMAQMPAAQRQMLMSRMGPQMEMMKKMADSGGLETVTEVHGIRINAGLPSREDIAGTMFGLAP